MLLPHYTCKAMSCSGNMMSCPRSHRKHKTCFHSVFKRSRKSNAVLRPYSLSMPKTFLLVRQTLGDSIYKLNRNSNWKFNISSAQLRSTALSRSGHFSRSQASFKETKLILQQKKLLADEKT